MYIRFLAFKRFLGRSQWTSAGGPRLPLPVPELRPSCLLSSQLGHELHTLSQKGGSLWPRACTASWGARLTNRRRKHAGPHHAGPGQMLPRCLLSQAGFGVPRLSGAFPTPRGATSHPYRSVYWSSWEWAWQSWGESRERCDGRAGPRPAAWGRARDALDDAWTTRAQDTWGAVEVKGRWCSGIHWGSGKGGTMTRR